MPFCMSELVLLGGVCVCARALGSVCTCWQHQDPPGKAGRNCVMLLYECRGDCSHSTSTWRPRSAYPCARPAFPFYCGNKSGPMRLHNPFVFLELTFRATVGLPEQKCIIYNCALSCLQRLNQLFKGYVVVETV